jgi:hypothetical protein
MMLSAQGFSQNDNGLWERTRETLKPQEEAKEWYIFKVGARASIQQQQPMCGRLSTYRQIFQHKEVGYSWDSLTCALP